MILTCPDCATRYVAKADSIGADGRMVRCASCNATWYVTAEPDILDLSRSAAPIDSVPDAVKSVEGFKADAIKKPVAAASAGVSAAAGDTAANAIRDKTERKRAARRVFGVSMMWMTTLGALGALAFGAYFFRQSIVEKYPASATIYKAFNIEVAQGGLVFGDVITRSAYVEGELTVIVEGRVRNPDRSAHPARHVKLSLQSASGEDLAVWIEPLPKAELEKGEAVSFISKYINPPVDALTLQYSFTDEDNIVTDGAVIGDAVTDSAIADESGAQESPQSDGQQGGALSVVRPPL